MSIAPDDVIFLLGAGASAEAKIPTSADMIKEIEKLIEHDDNWRPFRALYNHVKSGIYYSEGLRGRFGTTVNYNIETLVNTLYELERNEEHPLYPFIAAWNSRFTALANPDFSNVKRFRLLILDELKGWMCPDEASLGDYYRGLCSIQGKITYTLRVFSLNYDLCVERLEQGDFKIEAGFPGFGDPHPWDFRRFEKDDIQTGDPAQILLYKLHGSINWRRKAGTRELVRVEQVQRINAEHVEIIFGRDFKLEAADPYLFYAYSFRYYTLKARLIVTIGYGFGDAHINKILAQGLRYDHNRRLLAVCGCREKAAAEAKAKDITGRLELGAAEGARIVVEMGTAKEFLTGSDPTDILARNIFEEPNQPF